MGQAQGGEFLLRIDDLDHTRSRPEWETQLKSDLTWLGISWPEPCRRESDVRSEYDTALDRLWAMGLLYPCTCSRRDIREALSAPQEGPPVQGPDGLVYPGTCRPNAAPAPNTRRPRDATLRLNMARAITPAPSTGFTETGTGAQGQTGQIEFTPDDMISGVGDVVVSRKDFGASYHLAVVVDDAAQGVTHVIRGQDLFEATKIHVILQHLLGLPTPLYHHHRLIRDDTGKRLAKRDDARAIAKYRAEGATPQDIRRMVGLA